MKAVVKTGEKSQIIQLSPEKSVYSALIQNGLFLPASCGGNGSCGKCKAKLISSDFDIETDKNGEFLTCKCFPKGDMAIEIPLSKDSDIDIEFLSIFTGDKCKICLDLGTTTLCFAFLDEFDKVFAKISVLNPQRIIGADVLSRISYCSENGVDFAHQLIVNVINKVISKLKSSTNVKEIDLLTVCGNTVMTHIFMKVSPRSLGVSPFKPVFCNKITCAGKELGISAEKIMVFPTFSAFLGGDIVSGVGFLQLGKHDKKELFIDVGTNGEMVLFANGKFYCTSTSAGPAFEGGKISCGTGGVSGAICKVYEKSSFWEYETIGRGEVKGICGAGIVDFLSCALNCGAIDRSGKIISGGKGVKDNKIYLTRDIYLSQSDIREIQLAKSAIRCGIDMLLSYAKLSFSDIDTVYLSGGMGEKLNLQNACKLGIIPFELLDKCKQVENSALSGLLQTNNPEFSDICDNFLDNAEYVELSTYRDFDKKFIENLNF